MTISSILLLHLIFLTLFNGCLSANLKTIIVQSPKDNEEGIGKMQMEDFSFNSESATIQNEDDYNENLEKGQKEDLSTDSEIVMVQSQEDSNGRTDKIKMKDISSNPKNIIVNIQEKNERVETVELNMEDVFTDVENETVHSQEENNERTAEKQVENSSTNPESVVVKNQVDNNERTGRMKSENHPADFSSVMVPGQEDNGERFGRMQGDDNQPEKSFRRPILINGQYPLSSAGMADVPYRGNSDANQNVRRNSGFFRRTLSRPIRNRSHNGPITLDNISTQPPNREIINNNNNGKISFPINVPPAGSEKQEVREDQNIGNVVTEPPVLNEEFFARLVNDFAFKIVRILNLESNFVISPLSIFVALSMCYLGSGGKTRDQIEIAFGIRENELREGQLHQGIKNLLSMVLKEAPGSELFVANAMFLGSNFTADAQFEEDIRKYYEAELKSLDFRKPDSMRIINEWVARNTRNMITSIINRQPDRLTRLILLNAVFFKGIWKVQFPPSKTYNGKFYSNGGRERQVQFMRLLDETFPAFRSDKHRHTFIKLPYAGDQVSMIIALPFIKGQKPMPTMTDAILYNDVLQNMVNAEFGTVAIPKFRLEYSTKLKRALEGLGVNDIFDISLADLNKLRKQNDVYLSKIIHKAVVEVDEVGTTASAVTSDFVGLVYKNNSNFVADHPFAFYIMHEVTGLVLFCGKVYDFESEASDSSYGGGNVPIKSRPVAASNSNDRRGNVPVRSRPAEESGSDYERGNVPIRRKPTEASGSNPERERVPVRSKPAEASGSNSERERVPVRSRPPEASDSKYERGNVPIRPGPAEASDSNYNRGNIPVRSKPIEASGSDYERENVSIRPAEASDSDYEKGNVPIRSKPAEPSISNDQRQDARPAEASFSNDRRQNAQPAEGSISNDRRENVHRPAESSISNDRRESERTVEESISNSHRQIASRPPGASSSNDRRQNERPAEVNISNDRRYSVYRPAGASISNNRGQNVYRPAEESISDDRSERPAEESTSNDRRQNENPAEASVSNNHRRGWQQPAEGSNMDFS